jgi:hypothetical protein
MRLCGYRSDVVQFVSAEHTPRDLLLRARRTGRPPRRDDAEAYRALTSAWRVRPRLAELLEPRLTRVLHCDSGVRR